MRFDIIAKSEAAQRKPILATFLGPDSGQLQDVVLPTSIVGVGS